MRRLQLVLAVLVPVAVPLALGACSDGGGDPSEASFCDAFTAIQNSPLSDATGDEANIGELIESGRPLFTVLADDAPAEIHGVAASLAQAYGTFADYLKSISYDFDRFDAEAPEEARDAITTLGALDDDSSELGQYVEAHCDVDLPSPQFSSIGDSL